MESLYAGIDLHSNNNYLGILNERDERVYRKRLANQPEVVLNALSPFKPNLAGIAIESTYNWYWLVDALQDEGYRVLLANPSAIQQYEGLKHADDQWDSFWLAHMMRLGILPVGYIYPKEERPIRDMLRRRMLFVQQRTTQILSLQGMITRNLGICLSGNAIKKLQAGDVEQLFNNSHLAIAAKCSISTIKSLTEQIKTIEKEVLSHLRLKTDYEILLTIPGIGQTLASTIMLEAGDMRRFEHVGKYSSYCRCVSSTRTSNNKKKGKGNTKNGNKYLSWAYVEAANFAIRHNPAAKRFYQRKLSQTNKIVAIKALANKLARASYYMLRDQVPFDSNKLFDQ